jgi:hypothetical protein
VPDGQHAAAKVPVLPPAPKRPKREVREDELSEGIIYIIIILPKVF